MNKYNEQGLEQGPWEDYYSNGNLMYKLNYINGKKHGLYEWYSTSDKLNVKQYYL